MTLLTLLYTYLEIKLGVYVSLCGGVSATLVVLGSEARHTLYSIVGSPSPTESAFAACLQVLT
jgi:hypothetical protein